MKAAGRQNWAKLDAVISKIEAARREGLKVSADMYTYTAGATGLGATMPPWVQEGGLQAWVTRLRDPAVRARVTAEMRQDDAGYENLLRLAGGPENVLLISFKTDALKPLIGKSLAQISQMRGKSAEETALDLVVEDGSNPEAAFFQMSEANVRREMALPWMSFGSDGAALAPEGVFLKSATHPRAYGNFARLLGKYVRDEKVVALADAVRRLTSLPASNFHIRDRGALRPGNFADVVVFDPARIQDHATFERPHQYATGMRYVVVNGVVVLRDGEHTGATPGRAVRGPGWRGWPGGGACPRSG